LQVIQVIWFESEISISVVVVTGRILEVAIQFPPALEIAMSNGIIPHRTGNGGKTAGRACPDISFPIRGIGAEIIGSASGQSGERFSQGSLLGIGNGKIRIPGCGVVYTVIVPPVKDKTGCGIPVISEAGF
jgi:hypothetical protein